MAKYTEVLHDLLNNENTNNLIEKAMSSYPIYEPIHKQLYGFIPSRTELNKKILNHYRFYEIGSETVGRFLFNLETALNEIMPKYNQLYKSVDVMNGIDDIFGNVDITETYEEETSGNSKSDTKGSINGSNKESISNKTTGSSSSDSDTTTNSNVSSENNSNTEMNTSGRNVKSTTPQSQLSVKTIDNITAASEIGWNEDTNNSTSSSNDKSTSSGSNKSKVTSDNETSITGTNNSENSQTNNSITDYERSGLTKHTMNKKGNQGVNTYAHDMLEFRQLFLNIEQQIINDPEIANCFMLIW